MTPACPFLPGLETTLSGRARAKVTAHIDAKLRYLRRAPIAQFGRIFGAFIPDALVRPTSSGPHSRRRKFPLPVIFWAFLSQMLSPRTSCRETLRKVMAWCACRGLPLPSANSAAYCKARRRIPLDVLRAVFTRVASILEQRLSRHDAWHGRRVLIPDGTGLSMPDTRTNQKTFPQPSGQKKGCGFPVVKLVGLFSLASGALLGWAQGTLTQHDGTLWRSLWHLILPGDILLADRGFSSYASLALLIARGADAVFRLHQGRAKPHLSKHQHECHVTWYKPKPLASWPAKIWRALPDTLHLRIIRYRITHPGFRTTTVFLVTTLLDADRYPAEDLADLYLRRWSVELFFRDIKTSMRMDILAGKSPAMVRREIIMFAIAYNLIRAVMQDAANAYHLDLSRLSFKGTADALRQWSDPCLIDRSHPRRCARLYAQLLAIIALDTVPLRPGRAEPRAVKRRPKSYNLLNKPRHSMYVPPHHNRPHSRPRLAA